MDMAKRLKEVARDGDEDIWYWIFNHCSLRDCIRMGAVCKSWFSVCKWSLRSRPPQLPWLLSSLGYKKDPVKQQQLQWEEGRRFFSLSDDTMYDSINFPEIRGKRCCASFMNADARARGWLMIIDDESLGMILFHPWRRIQLQLPDFPFPVSQYPSLLPYYPPHRKWMRVIKAAMSDDASVVVVVFSMGQLAFVRMTDNDDKVWTIIDIDREGFKMYCDVIYHKGKFYVMTFDGGLGVIHINTTNPFVETLMEDHTIRTLINLRTYMLADSASESLFIFVRNALNHHDTVGFKVYELELEEETGEYKKNPVEVESLGDRIVFLGQNSSMLVMASQFPGFKGNCIYFTDDIMGAFSYKLQIKCVDLGIFNMEDKTVQPLFRDTFHHTLWPPIWIAPPL